MVINKDVVAIDEPLNHRAELKNDKQRTEIDIYNKIEHYYS